MLLVSGLVDEVLFFRYRLNDFSFQLEILPSKISLD